MTTSYETSINIDSNFVIAGSWLTVCMLLLHSAIIFIVPILSWKVVNVPWYNHSSALRHAMTVWTMHWTIQAFEAFGMSNYFVTFVNYPIICTISLKAQPICISLAAVSVFLCFVSTLQDSFQSTALNISPQFLFYLKAFIYIPLFSTPILYSILVETKVYTVKDDPNLLFCVNDPQDASIAGAVITIFGIWYILSEFIALGLFLVKMRKVMLTKSSINKST